MKLITRAQWHALSPRGAYSPWLRRGGVVIHHGASTVPAGHDVCGGVWLSYQRAHLANRDEGWIDIAYNFGVCPHGYVFEGRGWDGRSGANGTTADNATDLAICLIGSGDPAVPLLAVNAFREVIQAWSDRGGLTSTRPHGAITGSHCPGDSLRALTTNGSLGRQPTPDAKVKRLYYVWLHGNYGRKTVVDYAAWGDGRGVELAAGKAVRTVALANQAGKNHQGPEFRLVERASRPVVGKRL